MQNLLKSLLAANGRVGEREPLHRWQGPLSHTHTPTQPPTSFPLQLYHAHSPPWAAPVEEDQLVHGLAVRGGVLVVKHCRRGQAGGVSEVRRSGPRRWVGPLQRGG